METEFIRHTLRDYEKNKIREMLEANTWGIWPHYKRTFRTKPYIPWTRRQMSTKRLHNATILSTPSIFAGRTVVNIKMFTNV